MRDKFKFEEYRTPHGERALTVGMHLMDLTPSARYPLVAPPLELQQKARRASYQLRDALQDLIETIKVEQDLVSGPRLDPKKRHAVARGITTGYLDPSEVRPYMRRGHQADMPKLAIVASMAGSVATTDLNFMPMAQLALGLTWAAEAVDIEATTVLIASHARTLDGVEKRLCLNAPYSDTHRVFTLIDSRRPTAPDVLSYALNSNRLIQAYGERMVKLDREQGSQLAALSGRTYRDLLHERGPVWNLAFPNVNAGRAVMWARQNLDADIVICIGNATDSWQADVSLSPRLQLERAVQRVVDQIRKRKIKAQDWTEPVRQTLAQDGDDEEKELPVADRFIPSARPHSSYTPSAATFKPAPLPDSSD